MSLRSLRGPVTGKKPTQRPLRVGGHIQGVGTVLVCLGPQVAVPFRFGLIGELLQVLDTSLANLDVELGAVSGLKADGHIFLGLIGGGLNG